MSAKLCNKAVKQPPQKAAALCSERSFDDVYKKSEEDDAGDQIVQEVQTSAAGGEGSQLKTSCSDTHIHIHTHQ